MDEAVPIRRPTWPSWVEILLCSGYPTQIVITGTLYAAGLELYAPDGSLSARFVFALTLIDTVVLLSLIMVLLLRRGESPARVFFGGRPFVREAGAGVLSLPVVFAIVIFLSVVMVRFAPSLRTVPVNPLGAFLGTPTGLWIFLVVAIIGGGVREELQRAFLLHRFRGDLGQPWLGLFITSLAFGMGHTLQGLDAAVVTGTLGALWGALYLVRGSAVAPMVSHSLFNSSQLLGGFLR